MFCIIFATSRKTADTQPTQVSIKLCPALIGGTLFVSLKESVLPENHYPYYTINKLIGLIVSRRELTNLSYHMCDSGVTRNFFRGGGSTNSVEDRENGDLGVVAPLVRGSGGSCNLVQEISYHKVKFS